MEAWDLWLGHMTRAPLRCSYPVQASALCAITARPCRTHWWSWGSPCLAQYCGPCRQEFSWSHLGDPCLLEFLDVPVQPDSTAWLSKFPNLISYQFQLLTAMVYWTHRFTVYKDNPELFSFSLHHSSESKSGWGIRLSSWKWTCSQGWDMLRAAIRMTGREQALGACLLTYHLYFHFLLVAFLPVWSSPLASAYGAPLFIQT